MLNQFCLDDKDREFLVHLKRISEQIENFKDYNKMPLDALVKKFNPTISPDYRHYDLKWLKSKPTKKTFFQIRYEQSILDNFNTVLLNEDGVKILKPKNNTPLISQGVTTLEEPTNNINEESDLEEETIVVKEVEENI
ncbi:hypothetical protein CWI36_0236p0020 [Hamiltosporidium magnivora]|uniref:Uncharacterized protein n=1 Tax=Hamiltosporidium magnivora TaxID=148818 RepID=A0A4Q9LKT8_9MICR|nr:hypothetical protein CWI36_0236p0020 [Hamiltosporidium magnivora]